MFGLTFLAIIELLTGYALDSDMNGTFSDSLGRRFKYYILFILNGVGQSLVFPGISHINSNWFGKGKRGTVMGIWNSCIYIGNIYG